MVVREQSINHGCNRAAVSTSASAGISLPSRVRAFLAPPGLSEVAVAAAGIGVEFAGRATAAAVGVRVTCWWLCGGVALP